MKTLTINQPATVTRIGFRRDMSAYPRAIEFEGERYEFIDRGLSCTVKREGRLTKIFTVSTGFQQFWLRDDGQGLWTLLGMSS